MSAIYNLGFTHRPMSMKTLHRVVAREVAQLMQLGGSTSGIHNDLEQRFGIQFPVNVVTRLLDQKDSVIGELIFEVKKLIWLKRKESEQAR